MYFDVQRFKINLKGYKKLSENLNFVNLRTLVKNKPETWAMKVKFKQIVQNRNDSFNLSWKLIKLKS